MLLIAELSFKNNVRTWRQRQRVALNCYFLKGGLDLGGDQPANATALRLWGPLMTVGVSISGFNMQSQVSGLTKVLSWI